MITLTFAERYTQARLYARQVRQRRAMGDSYTLRLRGVCSATAGSGAPAGGKPAKAGALRYFKESIDA